MSCPAWFPASLFRSQEMGVAVEVMRVAAVFGPLTITLGPVVAALDAGVYFSRAGCDLAGGMCLWAERTLRDLTLAFRQKDNIEFVLSLGGVAIPAPVWIVLATVKEACERAPCDEDSTMPDAVATLEPTLTPTEIGESFGGFRSSLFNVYSHSYQAAAEEAYALDSSVDLRPWLLAQVPVDLRILRAVLPTYLVSRPDRAQQVLKASEGLSAWLQAARESPPGAWSRASVRRVLRTSELQSDIPPVVDDGDSDDNNNNDSNSGGLVVAGLLAAATAFAVMR